MDEKLWWLKIYQKCMHERQSCQLNGSRLLKSSPQPPLPMKNVLKHMDKNILMSGMPLLSILFHCKFKTNNEIFVASSFLVFLPLGGPKGKGNSMSCIFFFSCCILRFFLLRKVSKGTPNLTKRERKGKSG